MTDNGNGFDTTAKRTGLGLINMKTRAENLNGVLDITSSPGKGCQVVASFPYSEHAASKQMS